MSVYYDREIHRAITALLDAGQYLSLDKLDGIPEAIALAYWSHHSVFRESGESYFIHPVRVATRLAEMRQDSAVIIAGILHDVLEDADISIYDLIKQFGPDVAMLVDGVTKLDEKNQDVETFFKLLRIAEVDPRVFLIKFADVIDNLSTLHFLKAKDGRSASARRRQFALKAMTHYFPIAQRLGLLGTARSIERLASPYLSIQSATPNVANGIIIARSWSESTLCQCNRR